MKKEEVFEIVDQWAEDELLKNRQEMLDYIDEVFTKEEAERHADNLMNIMCGKGSIALLKLYFLREEL